MTVTTAAPTREIRILGYRLHPLSGEEVVGEVAAAVRERRRLVMANVNLHAMAVMFESEPMARLLLQPDAQVMIDSMPLLYLANLAGQKLGRDKRTTSLDFYDAMFALGAAEGWRFGYVGSTPETMTQGLAALRRRFPTLDIDGQDGFFDIADRRPGSRARAIEAWLAERSHDVVIAGMGMPRQEEWIAGVQDAAPTRVFLPAGAYLDYQVGAQKLTPRWMGQMGIEWLYRLVNSPRRLAYRYLVEPAVLGSRLATRPHPQAALRRPE